MRILLVCLALLPPILILIDFYKRDKYKPEPKRLIILLFIISGLTVFPAAEIEKTVNYELHSFLEPNFCLNNLFHSFIYSASVEEIIKFTLVWIIAFRSRYFDELVDGIIYAVTAGLGFAAVENIYYCLNSGIYIACIRAFTAVPLHCAASGLMGYFIGKAKFTTPRISKLYFLYGLTIAVLIHGTYNYLLFSIDYLEMYSVIGVILLLIFAFSILSRCIRQLLADDVANERHYI